MTMVVTTEESVKAKPFRHVWQRRKHARPNEILVAALAAFAARDYANTSMADIAARAGITKGTIYLYYRDKEDLFNALVREHIQKPLADAIAALPDTASDPLETLQAYLDAAGSVFFSSDALILQKLIIAASIDTPALAQYWREQVVAKQIKTLTDMIEECIKTGYILPIGANTIASLFLAPAMLNLVWRITSGGELSEDVAEWQSHLKLQREIIVRGLRSEA